MNTLTEIFEHLWQDYLALNPDARRIRALLEARGETIVNDHIALRTFDDPRIDIGVLARAFVDRGYQACGDYEFPAKKLDARHYEHQDADLPRVFISQLRLGEFSAGLQAKIASLLEEMPPGLTDRPDLAAAGRPWELSHADYEALREESEYAAWVAALGFRPNHFTVFVNALKTFGGIRELVAFLKEEGFEMNSSGGEIKGSPEVFLEQASTLANKISVDFSDGAREIPSCYYEFAERFELPGGGLFSGFIAKSADKIFESTDKR